MPGGERPRGHGSVVREEIEPIRGQVVLVGSGKLSGRSEPVVDSFGLALLAGVLALLAATAFNTHFAIVAFASAVIVVFVIGGIVASRQQYAIDDEVVGDLRMRAGAAVQELEEAQNELNTLRAQLANESRQANEVRTALDEAVRLANDLSGELAFARRDDEASLAAWRERVGVERAEALARLAWRPKVEQESEVGEQDPTLPARNK